MVRTIHQTVAFESVEPEELWDLYQDSKLHAAATGASARMSSKVGGAFSVWDGYATGKNLALTPKRLIVQSWRASDWSDSDSDSLLVLAFGATDDGAEVELVHAGVPDGEAESLEQGWIDNYWEPWKAWLAAQGAKERRLAKAPAARGRKVAAKKAAKKGARKRA